MSSVNEETPEQGRSENSYTRGVYPQRALTFLIIFVFVFLVGLLIIGLIGLKWINQTQENVYHHPSLFCKFHHFQIL